MSSKRLQGALIVLLALALAVNPGPVTRVAAQGGEPPVGPAAPEAPVGHAFTYQGQLNSGGTPLNGTCDMQFSLWDALAGPSQTGSTQTSTGVGVVGGKFTVLLNNTAQIGTDQFTGSRKWLQIAVRCPAGSGSYTTLSPRQELTAVPYALGLKQGAVINGSSTL